MPYMERAVVFKDHIEIKRYFSPSQSLKTRQAKRKKSRKAVEENNKNLAAEKLSWLLAENFNPDDWHFSPTFNSNNLPQSESDGKKIFQKFLRQLRNLYKKAGAECKYIWTVGCSSRGKIHIHLVLNHVDGIEFHDLKNLWKCGQLRLNNTLYENGWYKALATYLVEQSKPPKNQDETGKQSQRYHCSKNLDLPEIRKREINKKFWRKEKPTIPYDYEKNFVVDENSIKNEIRDFDGLPVQKFILVKKE